MATYSTKPSPPFMWNSLNNFPPEGFNKLPVNVFKAFLKRKGRRKGRQGRIKGKGTIPIISEDASDNDIKNKLQTYPPHFIFETTSSHSSETLFWPFFSNIPLPTLWKILLRPPSSLPLLSWNPPSSLEILLFKMCVRGHLLKTCAEMLKVIWEDFTPTPFLIYPSFFTLHPLFYF